MHLSLSASSLAIAALFSPWSRASPIGPFVGDGPDFYELSTENGPLPVFLPINERTKPDIKMKPLRTLPNVILKAGLAHTYLEVLDQLWRIEDVVLFQQPRTFTSTEFANIGLKYEPSQDAPVILTSVQATWGTLEILDYQLRHSNPANPNWNPIDVAIGNSKTQYGLISSVPSTPPGPPAYETARKARRAAPGPDDDTLLQDFAALPDTNLTSQAAQGYLSLNDLDSIAPPPDNSTAANTGNNEDGISVRLSFSTIRLNTNAVLYHFRTFTVYAMKYTANDDVSTRWRRDQPITPDPRVKKVQAMMVMRGPKGLFPIRVSFKDVTDALRQILAQCIRHGNFVAFRAEIVKDTRVVAELGMIKGPTEAIESF